MTNIENGTDRKVEWTSYAKEGKIEGINKSQIIQAIGSKEFCQSVLSEIDNDANAARKDALVFSWLQFRRNSSA